MIRRALSLKQPWAALVVAGLKTVEVRKWATTHRGPLLIHASTYDDTRSEGWARVPAEVRSLSEIKGGIIGEVDLLECREYSTLEAFLLDRELHHNEPGWYQEAGLFGFVMAGARVLPFQRAKGNVRLFGVEYDVQLPVPALRLEQTRPEKDVGPPAPVAKLFDRLARSLKPKG
jgi:hypothetical protein